MRNLIFALILLLASCGDGNSSEPSNASEPTISDETQKDLPAVSSTSSIALKTKENLPECLEANDTQLAYIIDEEIFYVCDTLEWQAVDIKGADGNDGSDGQDAELANTWTDPNTGLNWLIGGNGTWSTDACPDGWQRPNVWQGTAAVANGLLVASAQISGPDDIWSINEDVGSGQGTYVDANGAWIHAAKSGARGMFCYQ